MHINSLILKVLSLIFVLFCFVSAMPDDIPQAGYAQLTSTKQVLIDSHEKLLVFNGLFG